MSITHELRPYRVLVVDDLSHARLAIKTTIMDAVQSCEFVEAKNATEAEQVLKREEPFDLVVIDLKLGEPDKDGITLVEVIKQVLNRYSPTRIIVYTAYPTVETACEAYEAGADSYISKNYIDATAKLQKKAKELLEQVDIRESLRRQREAYRHAEKTFANNKKNWIEKYGGNFVIVKNGEVLASEKDPYEVWKLLNEKYTRNERCDIAIIQVPSMED